MDRRRSERERGPGGAARPGRLLLSEGYVFDVAYTSVLKRAIKTLWLVLEEMDLMWIPRFTSWRLNERHYGALQGLNKAETVEQARARADADLAAQLRRSAAAARSRRSALARGRTRATRACPRDEIPLTECLKDTVARFLPVLARDASRRRSSPVARVLIAAHGNSLRALVKYLDEMSATRRSSG